MKKVKQEVIDIWNKISDSDWYKSYRTEDAINAIIQNPASAFHPTTFSMLIIICPELSPVGLLSIRSKQKPF